jgi:hypothetical protein
MAPCASRVDSLPREMVRRVGRWGVGSYLLLSLGAFCWDRALGGGVAVGGALTLSLFGIHSVLAPTMFSAPTARRSRVLFWLVWTGKWPAIGAALFYSLRAGLASPLGLGAGAAILPAVATGLALHALVADTWARGRGGVQAS